MEKAFSVKLANEEEVKTVRTVGDLLKLIISLRDNQADN
jgi:acyl carrier protein